MKKRIVCILLTLIMLMSLVPTAAFAAGMSISESAITVLKQLEGYSTGCNGKGSTFGYGTVCTNSKAHTGHNEKEADAALRDALKDLDAAINNFASKKGLSLTQSKHDALVLFSFENGTAWTTGTGDFQSAVTSGKTGSEFLNAICWWDSSTADDDRRMIEANMYLNGQYSSSKPSRYIWVKFDANGGSMTEAEYQYFDTNANPVASIVPTRSYYTFMGWYTDPAQGARVTSVSDYNGKTLYAHWQAFSVEPSTIGNNALYSMNAEDAVALYTAPQGKKTDFSVKGTLTINAEYIDNDDVRWGRVVKAQKYYEDGEKIKEAADLNKDNWIKLGEVSFAAGSSSGSSSESGSAVDAYVTVTNSYINVRSAASVFGGIRGQVNMGDQLHITAVDTANNGALWGYFDNGVLEGWVALMYTDYVPAGNENAANTSNAIAKAVVTVNGYVNVRSGAGTDNQIVGSLPKGTEVDLYETKYVNGLQWGRCKTGWFCLAYADVTTLVQDNSYISDVGFTSYAFTGTLKNTWAIYKQPSDTAELVRTKEAVDPDITVTTLTEDADGNTWGKISEGWVMISDKDGNILDVDLDVAKFVVTADSLTVRDVPSASGTRKDTLVKGVEFNVNQTKQIIVIGETVWGYADKVGETNTNTYSGWVNLASKYVRRADAPSVEVESTTGQVATITGADNVRIRETHALYGNVLGTIARGTTVAILDEEDGWYMLDYDVDNDPDTDSWVYGTYVQVSDGTVSSGTSTSNGSGVTVLTGRGTGVVANTYAGVNVRQGAGTAYALVGKLLPGTLVNILETTTVGTAKWGRVAEGWICMDYVTMISTLPDEIVSDLTGGSNTSNGSTTTSSEPAIYTGTAKNAVTVYKTTSLDSEAVRNLSAGDPITMHEILTVTEYDDKVTDSTDSNSGSTTTVEKKTSYWARVNDGYIYAPADNLNLDTLDEHTYTVTESDTLNVRSDAGTDGTNIKHKLEKGDQVTVTQLKIVKNNVWGFIEADAFSNVTKDEEGNETVKTWDGYGWVCLSYMTKGAVSVAQQNEPAATTPTTPAPVIGSTGNTATGGFVNNTAGYKYTGKVINTDELNVRPTASTAGKATTKLKNGASLVIYETTVSEGMAWGRCDAGWVYLYYVDMTPCVNGAIDARVVYNDNTVIYTDMNCSGVAGTYSKMSVIDIYEIVGTMARTELGWVSTTNLL